MPGANGYVRSEGCGIGIFKEYNSSISDGENVLAVILGTGVNQMLGTTWSECSTKITQSAEHVKPCLFLHLSCDHHSYERRETLLISLCLLFFFLFWLFFFLVS